MCVRCEFKWHWEINFKGPKFKRSPHKLRQEFISKTTAIFSRLLVLQNKAWVDGLYMLFKSSFVKEDYLNLKMVISKEPWWNLQLSLLDLKSNREDTAGHQFIHSKEFVPRGIEELIGDEQQFILDHQKYIIDRERHGDPERLCPNWKMRINKITLSVWWHRTL